VTISRALFHAEFYSPASIDQRGMVVKAREAISGNELGRKALIDSSTSSATVCWPICRAIGWGRSTRLSSTWSTCEGHA